MCKKKTFSECYNAVYSGEHESPKSMDQLYDEVGQPTINENGKVNLNECYDKVLMNVEEHGCEEGPQTISEAYTSYVNQKFQDVTKLVNEECDSRYTELYLQD